MKTNPNKSIKLDPSDLRFKSTILGGLILSISIHFFFSLLFIWLQIYVMSVINLYVSISAFVIRWRLVNSNKNNLKLIYLFAITQSSIAAFMAGVYMGYPSGFYYYFFTLIPATFLYNKWSYIEKSGIIFLLILFIVAGYSYDIFFPPLSIQPQEIIRYSNIGNLFGGFVTLTGLIIYFSFSFSHIETRIMKYNKLLENKNEEKSVMLKEIHHRVKNNLHVVNSILEVQRMDLKDEQVKNYLKDAQNRIMSMATIHEKMYGSENLKHINLRDYITDLIVEISSLYDGKSKINVDLNLRDIPLSIEEIGPMAFLINEVITNSYKHAFKNTNEPKISVSVFEKDGVITLNISDNGSGKIASKSDDKNMNFGSSLIDSFAEELDATYKLDSTNGMKYCFEFLKKPVA